MRLCIAALAFLSACDEVRELAASRAERVAHPGVDLGPWMLHPSSTSMTIAWTTRQAVAGEVRFGKHDLDQTSTSGATTDHRAVLGDLEPATRYRFQVEGHPPADGSFTTAPAPGASTAFTMAVYGDNRTNGGDHALVARAIAGENVSVALHTGDMVVDAKDSRAWRHWFAEERDLLSHVPLVPTVGNHELTDEGVAYSRWFQEPGRPGYHSFDYGPVHVAVLDSFEMAGGATPAAGALSEAQRQWLLADVKAVARDRHLFVLVHQGPYAHPAKPRGPNHGGSLLVARALLDAALIHPVAAVFAGHEHFYERGEIDGLRYFVVGGGGAPLEEPDAKFPGVQSARKALSYVVLDVRGCQVAGRAKDIAGNVIDSFALGNCPAPPVVTEGAK